MDKLAVLAYYSQREYFECSIMLSTTTCLTTLTPDTAAMLEDFDVEGTARGKVLITKLYCLGKL